MYNKYGSLHFSQPKMNMFLSSFRIFMHIIYNFICIYIITVNNVYKKVQVLNYYCNLADITE